MMEKGLGEYTMINRRLTQLGAPDIIGSRISPTATMSSAKAILDYSHSKSEMNKHTHKKSTRSHGAEAKNDNIELHNKFHTSSKHMKSQFFVG